MQTLVSPLADWFQTTITGTAVWSAIGLVAVIIAGFIMIWLLAKAARIGIRALQLQMASRKRRSSQGFGIAVAPIAGPGGGKQTRGILAALEKHLHLFTFGSPSEIVRAPRLRAHGAKGLRAAAIDYLESSSTDLVLWGRRDKNKASPSQIDILSCGGSLAPADAMHLEGYFPALSTGNEETTAQVIAYLVARALQPGLADGSSFKAEKLAPVADILVQALTAGGDLPARTLQTLENDYAAMALHLGGAEHLSRVAELRRTRLSSGAPLPPEQEIQARIDLGRALLGLATLKFDPVQIREAMDQLQLAVERLKTVPIMRLAQATNQAVQQGQTMLANRQRFSVTGGSNV